MDNCDPNGDLVHCMPGVLAAQPSGLCLACRRWDDCQLQNIAIARVHCRQAHLVVVDGMDWNYLDNPLVQRLQRFFSIITQNKCYLRRTTPSWQPKSGHSEGLEYQDVQPGNLASLTEGQLGSNGTSTQHDKPSCIIGLEGLMARLEKRKAKNGQQLRRYSVKSLKDYLFVMRRLSARSLSSRLSTASSEISKGTL